MERLPASQPSSRGFRGPRRTGQGLVEFALILPVLLILVFVVIEVARVLHAWLAVENGARFGVRYAVTGEFDGNYCVVYGHPGGVCLDPTEEDGARIPSIGDAVSAGAVAILRDATATTVGEGGFFKVTVCSNKPGLTYFASDPNTPQAAECRDDITLTPVEDAGGPGDRVSVTVDFDHPLITPILSEFWPVLHLSAKREGIVEQFRTARVVGLPATIAGPTFTPSITPTASDTPTPSDTPMPTETATLTPSPTPSPTPSCADIYITDFWDSGDDDLFASVQNDNAAQAFLVSTTLLWPDLDSATASEVNYLEWDGTHYMDSNDSSSPTGPVGSSEYMGGNSSGTWHADFNNQPPEGIWGFFQISLTFDFPGWGTCSMGATLSVPHGPTLTPSPTRTPSRTPTPGPSPTRTPTRTPSRTPTTGPSPTPTRTRTPTPTSTTGPSPTRTPTPTATATIDVCVDC